MPVVKLILLILLVLVIGAFVVFNINHTSSVSIWPTDKGTFSDVPILLSFFVLYILGLFSAIPFFIEFRHRRKREPKTSDAAKKPKNEKAGGKTRILGAKSNHDESADSEQEDETE